jgi:two-component system response regulator HydG
MTPPAAPGRVLVVDDEPASRELLEIILRDEGLEADTVPGGAQALSKLEAAQYDVVASDLQMPGMDGIALTQAIRERHPDLEVLILTAFGSQESAHEVGRLQADYLRKPFDKADFLHRIARLVEKTRMARELRELRETLRTRRASSAILGDSRAIRAVLEPIAATARTDYPVLITGESGTGKELVARAIHEASHRARGPFVAVNCGAIPVTLFESEFFGHVRGAFTGAVTSRAGLFEEADGGTIFLDEIGEIGQDLQVKLLRVLQSSEVKRVGDTRTTRVDVRPICATNRDLGAMVGEGAFRQDLFYRINVIPMRLPPLRERRDDVPLLARHFLQLANAGLSTPSPGFSAAALEKLAAHSWPGNVRELENKVKQAALMANGREVRPDDVLLDSMGSRGGPAAWMDPTRPYEECRDRFEREYLVQALSLNSGSVTRTADAMQMHRNSLYHLLRKHDLDPADYR